MQKFKCTQIGSRPSSQGFILMTVMVTVFFISLVGVATTQLALSNLQRASSEVSALSSQLAADAGIDAALQEINQDSDYTGSGGPVTLHEDSQKRVYYETSISNTPEPLVKILHVKAHVNTPKSDPEERFIRKYDVELRGLAGGDYSIVTGAGGLIMRNSSRILNGSVFVNGKLSMHDTSQIGSALTSAEVKVAHKSCPAGTNPGPAYPRICSPTEDGQPISLNNSSRIYGSVQARNQTDGSGMLNPGLEPGIPGPIALPNYDRPAHKSAVTSTISGSSAACTTLFGISLPRTWQPNLKINGNVTVPTGCAITVSGDVWITGNLTLNPGSLMVTLLADAPVIMIDGSSGLTVNGGINLSLLGVLGLSSNLRYITYHNSLGDPDATPTGTDLYNSQSIPTIRLSGLLPSLSLGGEFYARWSKLEASGSAGVNAALAGQQIEIRGSLSASLLGGSNVSGLDDAGTWVIASYKRVYN